MWKCQVLILSSDARDWMCYEELRAFCEWDCANPLPLLPLCFLLIEQLQLHCLFCYLLPKIYPCVFRSSMRIHCYLTIDNRRGCLLRSWPAWCFVVVVLWIFFCLLKSELHYRKHLCLEAPHSALERLWSAAEVLWLAGQAVSKRAQVLPCCRATPEAC